MQLNHCILEDDCYRIDIINLDIYNFEVCYIVFILYICNCLLILPVIYGTTIICCSIEQHTCPSINNCDVKQYTHIYIYTFSTILGKHIYSYRLAFVISKYITFIIA